MPSSRSARAKLVGSCTPFSLEQTSHRFTFCILPSRIWVRKTVASLHLQTSHNIAVLDHKLSVTFNPCSVEHLLRREHLPVVQGKIGMPLSRVSSRNLLIIRAVIGPGLPSPIMRPSALITGMTSAAVPVRK